MCSPSLFECRLSLTDNSKFYIKKQIGPRFKFGEYFFFNKEVIARKKVYATLDSKATESYFRKNRHTKVKPLNFHLVGLTNRGGYGNCYLVKRKGKYYYLKMLRSIWSNGRSSLDLLTINYMELLRERDALLNCGGLWTPKVLKTFDLHNLPIMVSIEAVVGWSLKTCVNIVHVGSCSRCLIYSKRNQMTIKAQSALLTGSPEFIDPLKEEIVPILKFWMAELLVAVRYIHSQGVLHRDLRPENIIVTERGHIKLTDFCLNADKYKLEKTAQSTVLYECVNCTTELPESIVSPDPFDMRRRSFGNRHLYPFKLFGSTAYAAPELHSTSTVAEFTSKCDYWSCGCIFFYMLFMINPFDVTRSSLEEAKLSLETQSLLHPLIIGRRCWTVPSAKQLLMEVLCVEPRRRLDDNFDEAKWAPENLEFFSGINFDNLQSLIPPFKPIIQNLELCFDLLPMDKEDIIYDILEGSGGTVSDIHQSSICKAGSSRQR